jgi:putative ABC transport system ATP-binding protein
MQSPRNAGSSVPPTGEARPTYPADGSAPARPGARAASRRTMIELEGVTKIYSMGENEVRALNHVDLTITEGEMVAIMGPSGSGKSTMMGILGCLDAPTDGLYRLDGIDVAQRNENELASIRNTKIGFVFQSFHLIPRVSAIRNVELPLVYANSKDRVRRAEEAMEQVGLANRHKHLPNELSGGQQQRVAIARALVTDPAILLADEPTGNLDTASSQEIMGLLVGLNEQGRTVILITHEEDIAAYAKRVIRLRDGKIVSDSIVDQPDTPGGQSVDEQQWAPIPAADQRLEVDPDDFPTEQIDTSDFPTEQFYPTRG